jgi:CO/xanthine dehydrogenase Mo-binding subunit
MANPSLTASPDVDDWIAIDADGRVHVRSGKVDFGQRISTAIAIIAAEELEVDAADIIVEARQTGVTPDEGVTAGSNSRPRDQQNRELQGIGWRQALWHSR